MPGCVALLPGLRRTSVIAACRSGNRVRNEAPGILLLAQVGIVCHAMKLCLAVGGRSNIDVACATFEQVKAYGIGVAVAYPPDTDTPGFETENVGKPEVTRLIGEDAGGLFSPTQASSPIKVHAAATLPAWNALPVSSPNRICRNCCLGCRKTRSGQKWTFVSCTITSAAG